MTAGSPFLPVDSGHRTRVAWGPVRIAPCREFNETRRAQGFRDQDHLDRWFRAYDHVQACGDCGQPGPAYATTDGGWQPTETRCAEAVRLLDAAR
jgi:hypothetical protein